LVSGLQNSNIRMAKYNRMGSALHKRRVKTTACSKGVGDVWTYVAEQCSAIPILGPRNVKRVLERGRSL